MRVLIDGDASPVKDITICLCKEFGVKCIIYMDYSHEYESNYAEVIFCDKGRDSVDLKISNNCLKDDIVITQDYGLATVILAKGGKVLHNNGFIIDEKNIDSLLESRFLGKKLRDKVKIKGPKKRTDQDDKNFSKMLRILLGGNYE
ncbi:MAG: DUF188 domain-containing protein [bacterium]|nr:DUF188 domain-containing protein [bacterium]